MAINDEIENLEVLHDSLEEIHTMTESNSLTEGTPLGEYLQLLDEIGLKQFPQQLLQDLEMVIEHLKDDFSDVHSSHTYVSTAISYLSSAIETAKDFKKFTEGQTLESNPAYYTNKLLSLINSAITELERYNKETSSHVGYNN